MVQWSRMRKSKVKEILRNIVYSKTEDHEYQYLKNYTLSKLYISMWIHIGQDWAVCDIDSNSTRRINTNNYAEMEYKS